MAFPATSLPMAASVLLAPLLDGPPQPLHLVHRSRLALSLADDGGQVVLGVMFPGAVRLPCACAVAPTTNSSQSFSVGSEVLRWGDDVYAVARWWRPARSGGRNHQPLRAAVDDSAVRRLLATWRTLLGRGPGLTPYGDDVLCGALVALHAVAHPRLPELAAAIRAADLEARTTATSAALLRSACDGWCIDQLHRHLTALATGLGEASSRAALLAVGGSSGRGLLEGLSKVLPAATAEAA